MVLKKNKKYELLGFGLALRAMKLHTRPSLVVILHFAVVNQIISMLQR